MKNQGIVHLTLGELSYQHFVPVGWYHNTFNTDFTMEWDLHQQFELMYCSYGSFCFEYLPANATGPVSRVTVPEKHFIFVNTGYHHRITIETPHTRIYNIEFFPQNSFSGESEIMRKLSLSARELFAMTEQLAEMRNKNEAFYIYSDTHDVYATLKKMVTELSKNENPQRDVYIRILTLKLFIEISWCSYNRMLTPIKLSYVRKAVLYMQKNATKPLGTREIASAVGIADAYLQRLFKAELGESIHTTLTKIRLNIAKKFLENSSLSHTEIAKLSGFFSRETLAYAFRRFERCTPGEYRNSSRVNDTRTFYWREDFKLENEVDDEFAEYAVYDPAVR